MIFPKLSVPDMNESKKNSEFGSEIAWDFATNQPVILNGEIQTVSGVDALRIWIEKALRTERYKWSAYKWSYGAEIEKTLEMGLVGPALNHALQQSITNALIYHPHISQVGSFNFKPIKDQLEIEFQVKTILDDTVEVNLIV